MTFPIEKRFPDHVFVSHKPHHYIFLFSRNFKRWEVKARLLVCFLFAVFIEPGNG